MALALQLEPIVKNGTRILRPQEFAPILSASGRIPGWQGSGLWGPTFLVTLLMTGMRYVEGQRLQWHGSEWYKGGPFLHLPKEAVGKVRRTQVDRWVRLTPMGCKVVKKFIGCPVALPSWWAWGDALKRWANESGIDPSALGPKTMRKTWESWLIFYYRDKPNSWPIIAQSQGHTGKTSMDHYLNAPFVESERLMMEPWVRGYL
ncbi:MAG: site-specific integrase [Thaumarchaeota archaeon]|nr:site-specific integrase [Nitrososphaerota archaeon]